ncbi:MAG TPA: tetratricopeptide repeat protein [Acidobacteria bacterium]|nr:tetratricopeptide repeat protein [Acidobacteriota bacterium]
MRSMLCILSIAGVLTSVAPVHAQSTASGQPLFEDRAEAYHAFMLGRSLEGAGDIDGAVAAYERAAELDPAASDIWAELAALYNRRNRPDEAIAAGNAALERDPDNAEAHRTLGFVFAARAGARSGPAQDDVDRAVDHLERARDQLTADAGLSLTLGRLYVTTQQSAKAIEVLNELLDAEPRFTEALVLLGQAHETQGDWVEAAAAYERAVTRSPRRTRYRRQLANALLNAGQPDRALEVVRELVRVRPDDAGGWYSLSELELELENYDEAEAAAQRLVEIEPDNLRGAYMLSRVLGAQREYQGMVDALEPAVRRAREGEIAPSQLANLLQRLSVAHRQLGDHDAAIDRLREALDLTPSNLGLQAQLAQVYLDARRLDEAVAVVSRAQQENPGNLALLRIEAQTLSVRGEVGAAVAVLERALSQHEDQPGAHVALADMYSQHDRVDDAVRVLEAAEARFPENTLVVFQLGAVFERGQRYREAEGAFRRALDRDPEDAATLNYLGYMLAERGERLDESVDLIQRALVLDPNNGSYLDSLGWAYLKQNRLELAERPLRQASDQLRRNSVVQDHLGDLLFRLERYAEAISAWERALAGDGDTVDLSVIQNKIRDSQARLPR